MDCQKGSQEPKGPAKRIRASIQPRRIFNLDRKTYIEGYKIVTPGSQALVSLCESPCSWAINNLRAFTLITNIA